MNRNVPIVVGIHLKLALYLMAYCLKSKVLKSFKGLAFFFPFNCCIFVKMGSSPCF